MQSVAEQADLGQAWRSSMPVKRDNWGQVESLRLGQLISMMKTDRDSMARHAQQYRAMLHGINGKSGILGNAMSVTCRPGRAVAGSNPTLIECLGVLGSAWPIPVADKIEDGWRKHQLPGQMSPDIRGMKMLATRRGGSVRGFS
jgi:hypothetical protein